MASLAKKRILIDIKNFYSDKDNLTGIYAHFDEEDIYRAKAMIIGPDDTPYSGGFYFFDIEFPKNYPLYPPKVTFITTDSRIRFNPNLYINGKVCVSILGTWQGPGWTSVMTFNNVVLSIQTLLNNRPIQNEPGWENETGERCIKYNQIIDYYNYEVAILKMINNTPPGFEVFKEDMENHISNNIDKFMERISRNVSLDNKEIKAHIYGLYLKPRYQYLLKEFEQLRKTYSNKKDNINEKSDDNIDTNITEIEIKKRKSPSEPSKNYNVGDIVKSDNDGNDWKVVKFGDKTRWMLCK